MVHGFVRLRERQTSLWSLGGGSPVRGGAPVDFPVGFFFVWSVVVRWSKKGDGGLGNSSACEAGGLWGLEILLTGRHLCQPIGGFPLLLLCESSFHLLCGAL